MENASDQNSLPRRDQILQTAIHVFAERGYLNTDVQLIANLCGIGKGTVYRTFESKDNLFFEAALSIFEALERRLKIMEEMAGSTFERLEFFLTSSAELFARNPSYIKIMQQTRSLPLNLLPDRLVTLLQNRFIDAGCVIFREAMDKKLMAIGNPMSYQISMMNSMWGVISHYNAAMDPLSLVERVRFTFHLFLNGILLK
ncbi:MAG: TetR/AcrR family transcriptional regulator [Planctomycetia bacterium]|nr:TetR/AcrR family transcriptional regulator [Planctomycetia bacterium]